MKTVPYSIPVITFLTWGPQGSNHEYATRRYIDALGLGAAARIDLVDDIGQGAADVIAGRADHLVLCAVHPQAASTVALYRQGLYLVDSFISKSRDLAVVRRRAAAQPCALALMEPTRGYVDTGRWAQTISVASVSAVADGLRDGRFDAGISWADLAQQDPAHFIVDEFIGSVDDAWLVFGRQRLSDGAVLVWPDSPAARLMRGQAVDPGR
ncbi:hypothetical protein [Piscinibacter sakaiensis]|uniref:hypothetical protein n=1 Tax=Piscinibacter sakaiensis TaxID=1547922 RepID=UPI003AB07658